MDEVRAEAFKTWAVLIKAANMSVTERGAPPTVANDLLQTFLGQVLGGGGMDQITDAEMIGACAEGIADCVKAAGSGQLSAEHCQGLMQKVFEHIEKSFARSTQQEKEGAASGR